jgi:hypothetical protein
MGELPIRGFLCRQVFLYFTLDHPAFCSAAKPALPYNQDFPTEVSKRFEVFLVSLAITIDFCSPIFAIRLWNSVTSATRMTMPEATVNKDQLPQFWECHIRLTR